MKSFYIKSNLARLSGNILRVCIILSFALFLSQKSFSQKVKIDFHPGYILPISNNFHDFSYGYYFDGNLSFELSKLFDFPIGIRYEKMIRTSSNIYSHYNYTHWLLDFGPKLFITNEAGKFYTGLDLNIGLVHKDFQFTGINKRTTETDFPLYGIAPYIGFSYPVSENLNFDTNAKLIYWLGDTEMGFLNIGVGLEYEF